jgi:hypothetical protein
LRSITDEKSKADLEDVEKKLSEKSAENNYKLIND